MKLSDKTGCNLEIDVSSYKEVRLSIEVLTIEADIFKLIAKLTPRFLTTLYHTFVI